jgi:hypothetical protein
MTPTTFLAQRANDAESRGQLGYNCGSLKTHADAAAYARTKYPSVYLQECCVAGWNMARWKAEMAA